MKIFSLFLCLIASSSYGQITFQNIYGGTVSEAGNSVLQTNDGGYIILGSTTSFGSGGADIYLVRTDSNGNMLWNRTYGGTGDDWGSAIAQTNDSGFIIAGSTSSFGAGLDDIYLLKIDANGDTLWSKTYGGTDDDEGYSVQQTNDGGYIVTGSTLSFGAGSDDVYLIKTDASGNMVWNKTYGGTNIDIGNSVRQTKDGGYIVAGETYSFGVGGFDIYLLKTDANGNEVWNETIGGGADDNGTAVQQTSDNGYIITGITASFGAGNYDAILIKTDANGTVNWSRTYGGTSGDESYSVQQTKDGGYIFGGYTSSFGFGNFDAYVIKTKSNGDTIWTKVYGGTDYDAANSVLQTNDGGYIIAGYSNILNAGGNEEIYLLKTDVNGNLGCNEDTTATIVSSFAAQTTNPTPTVSSGCLTGSNPLSIDTGGNENIVCTSVSINELTENNKAVIYPNPFSQSAKLTMNAFLSTTRCELVIYDVTGRTLQHTIITDKSTIINRGNLSAGLYFYRVTNQECSVPQSLDWIL